MRAFLALVLIGLSLAAAMPAQAAISACSNPPTAGSTCPGATCSSLGQTQMSQDNQNIIACVYNASSALVWKTTSASAACSGNQVVTSIVNGIPACGAASPAVTVVNCPAGQVVLGVVNGVPQCGTVAAANVSCGANLVMTGVNASGQPMCSSSDGNLSCPAGQVLVGVSNDTPSCVTPGSDVTATCPGGYYLQGISSGSPNCVALPAVPSTVPTPPACLSPDTLNWNGSAWSCVAPSGTTVFFTVSICNGCSFGSNGSNMIYYVTLSSVLGANAPDVYYQLVCTVNTNGNSPFVSTISRTTSSFGLYIQNEYTHYDNNPVMYVDCVYHHA